jgi:hypothetical protein
MVRHTVSYYPHWREIFDKSQKTASEFGFTPLYVMRDEDNSNMLTIVGSVQSLDKIKDFMASDYLKSAMKKSGVLSEPEIYYFSDILEVRE